MRYLLLLLFFVTPAFAEDEPIWVQKKSICVWIHPEYREEWGRTLVIYEPPFSEIDIQDIQFHIDNNSRAVICTEDAT